MPFKRKPPYDLDPIASSLWFVNLAMFIARTIMGIRDPNIKHDKLQPQCCTPTFVQLGFADVC